MTKSLIISLVIILLLFTLSAILSSVCMNTVRRMQALALSLPDNIEDLDSSQLDEIDAIWSSRRGILFLILKKDLVINTDISVKTLCAYGSSDANGDYQYARYALLINLDAIAKIGSITLDAVF